MSGGDDRSKHGINSCGELHCKTKKIRGMVKQKVLIKTDLEQNNSKEQEKVRHKEEKKMKEGVKSNGIVNYRVLKVYERKTRGVKLEE